MATSIEKRKGIQVQRMRMALQPQLRPGRRRLPWILEVGSWKREWAKDHVPTIDCQHCDSWLELSPYRMGDRLAKRIRGEVVHFRVKEVQIELADGVWYWLFRLTRIRNR